MTATYVVDITPEGRKRRKVTVRAASESEARQTAIRRVYGAGTGSRRFTVHNITRKAAKRR